MRWVTRRKAPVDRIACPWLIQRFIDPDAEFLFVPEDQVMQTARREGALPFDVPALGALADIVRGADTDARHIAREAWGLYAVASGFREITGDDFENMRLQFPVYDALYAYCRTARA